jgi:general secretion pathway protein H
MIWRGDAELPPPFAGGGCGRDGGVAGSSHRPPLPAPARNGRGKEAGFTLLEMIIVLVILSLVVGIAVSRGPQRSHGLEVRGLIASVVEALRGARGRAIAGNRPVLIAVNGERRSIAVDGGPTIQVPPELELAAVAGPAGEPGKHLAGIRFAPDGSSTGGRIVFADGRRHTQIGIDWLTGRVSVADVP